MAANAETGGQRRETHDVVVRFANPEAPRDVGNAEGESGTTIAWMICAHVG